MISVFLVLWILRFLLLIAIESHSFTDHLLVPTLRRSVISCADQLVRQMFLPSDSPVVIMGVFVALTIIEFFHQFGRGVANMHGDRQGPAVAHFGLSLFDSDIAGVTFGRSGEVGHSLGQSDSGFGQADKVDGLLDGEGHLQRAWVGIADILRGKNDHPPHDE